MCVNRCHVTQICYQAGKSYSEMYVHGRVKRVLGDGQVKEAKSANARYGYIFQALSR